MKVIDTVTKISIILWNVWLLPFPISFAPRGRAERISELLVGQDIVILNEAFTHKDVLMKEAGYEHFATLGGPSPVPWDVRLVDSGLLIMSKYPFIKVEKEIFKKRAGSDRFSSKGVIMVRIIVNATEIDIYATHMQSGSSFKRGKSRVAQVRQLADFINQHSGSSKSSRRVIVAGDMNMGPLIDFSMFNWAYSTMSDKLDRTAAYTGLKALTGLEDANYSNPYWQQDINRFLVRNVGGIVDHLGKPCNVINGKYVPLSDSDKYQFSAEIRS
jgi:endonuclease/exonuclease/phosphatase family metal-dependent hydrolase